MSDLTVSTIALALRLAPGVLHLVEVAFPLLARWIVNFVLPFFGGPLPSRARSLTGDEQLAMLDAAIDTAPEAKKEAASDYVFLLLFEQRQNALAFLSIIVGIVYGLTLPLAERGLLHRILIVVPALFTLVDLNHAGVPLLGHHHPRISQHGRNVGIVFSAFWALATTLNVLSYSAATGA